jgi:hypothetical protein
MGARLSCATELELTNGLGRVHLNHLVLFGYLQAGGGECEREQEGSARECVSVGVRHNVKVMEEHRLQIGLKWP